MTTTTTYASAMRSAIESNCKVFLGWTVPASECKSLMRFVPLTVSDYICGLSPNVPISAANNYIWQMAFAETREVAANAMSNLASLLNGIVEFGDDFSEE